MKRTFATLLLTLGLASTAALADIAVYSGTAAGKALAGADSKNGVVKTFVVIDLATGQTQAVEYFKFFIFKRYSVSPAFTATKTTVTDKKGKTSTVFAYANTVDNVSTTTFQSALLSGTDSQVDIGSGTPVTLPKQVKGNSYILTAGEAGQPVGDNSLVTASSVLKLDVKWSKKANAAPAKSLSETIDAITAFLESKEGGKYSPLND